VYKVKQTRLTAVGRELPQGQVIDQVVELRDIMPTLLEAAGVPIPPSVDGASVLRLCRNDTVGWREFIQGEHTTSYERQWGSQWITDGKEKYIWFHHTGREFFFNLEEDPGECRNLSGEPQWQGRIAIWRERLAAINERRGDPRGQAGKLVVQPQGAITLSPNYYRWKERAEALATTR